MNGREKRYRKLDAESGSDEASGEGCLFVIIIVAMFVALGMSECGTKGLTVDQCLQLQQKRSP